MKVRVGFGKERRFIDNVETYEEIKSKVVQEFGLNDDVHFVLKLGDNKVNLSNDQRLSEAGIVSGDLLMVHLTENGENVEPDPSSSMPKVVEAEKMEVVKALPMMSFESVKIFVHHKMTRSYKFKLLNETSTALTTRIHTHNAVFSTGLTPWAECHWNLEYFGNDDMPQSKHLARCFFKLISDSDTLHHFPLRSIQDLGYQDKLDDLCHGIREFLIGPDCMLLSTFFFGDPYGLPQKLCTFLNPESLLALSTVCQHIACYTRSPEFDQVVWKPKLEEFMTVEGKVLPTRLPPMAPTYRQLLVQNLRSRSRSHHAFMMQRERERRAQLERLRNNPRPYPLREQPFDFEYEQFEPPYLHRDFWRHGEVLPNHPPRPDPAQPVYSRHRPDPDMPEGPSNQGPSRRGDPGQGGGMFRGPFV